MSDQLHFLQVKSVTDESLHALRDRLLEIPQVHPSFVFDLYISKEGERGLSAVRILATPQALPELLAELSRWEYCCVEFLTTPDIDANSGTAREIMQDDPIAELFAQRARQAAQREPEEKEQEEKPKETRGEQIARLRGELTQIEEMLKDLGEGENEVEEESEDLSFEDALDTSLWE